MHEPVWRRSLYVAKWQLRSLSSTGLDALRSTHSAVTETPDGAGLSCFGLCLRDKQIFVLPYCRPCSSSLLLYIYLASVSSKAQVARLLAVITSSFDASLCYKNVRKTRPVIEPSSPSPPTSTAARLDEFHRSDA